MVVEGTVARRVLQKAAPLPPPLTVARFLILATVDGGAVDLLHAGHHFCRDHNGVARQHLLEHEYPKVKIVDEAVVGVAPRIVGGERSIGLVSAAVGSNQLGRIFVIVQGLSVMNAMDQHIRDFGEIPT